MQSRTRLKPDDRKEKILNAALVLAAKPNGWNNLTRHTVAKEAQCSEGLVSVYFGKVVTLRKVVMQTAVKKEILPIVIQGLMTRDKYALKASFDLKAAAIQSLG